jgi:hypothetical protein
MLPAVLTSLEQTRETNGLIHSFVESMNDALSRRFFCFSNCTAAFFFEPGTEDYNELYVCVYNIFEQRILTDLLDTIELFPNDLEKLPLWAGGHVLQFAGQFIRSPGVHQSAFVYTIDERITSTQTVKRLLEKSHRPNAAIELRSILMAFGSLNLLMKAMVTSDERIDIHVILKAYTSRVEKFFKAEPTLADGLYVRFRGPVNTACLLPDEPYYLPVKPATGGAHAALAKLLVAAHRTLCCVPGHATDILATTNFVVSFLYSPCCNHIWTMSRASIPVRAPAVAAAPVASAAPHADLVAPPTPRVGAPKTPSGRVKPPTPTEASRTFRPPSAEAMLKAINGFSSRITSPSNTF